MATPHAANLEARLAARAVASLAGQLMRAEIACPPFEEVQVALRFLLTPQLAKLLRNALLGFVLSRKAVAEAEILTIVLAPSARGGGHSHRLLREHLTALTFAGIRTVHLEVDEGNKPALKLYARHGFHKVGERKGYYPLPDGSRATALTMSATLS